MFKIEFSDDLPDWASDEPELLRNFATRSSDASYSFDRKIHVGTSDVNLSKGGYTPVLGIASEFAWALTELKTQSSDLVLVDADSWPWEIAADPQGLIRLTSFSWVHTAHGINESQPDETFTVGTVSIPRDEITRAFSSLLDRFHTHLAHAYAEARNNMELDTYVEDLKLKFR